MSGQRDEMAAVLAEHEPVIGATYMPNIGPRGSIVGCSCLTARDYRAAGYKAGQEGWRAHLAEQITAAGFGPVRAVEAERDEWQVSAFSALDQRDRQRARAESAEAALAGRDQQLVDAAREIGTLRAGVEAEWFNGNIADDVRDRLLASTPDREEES